MHHPNYVFIAIGVFSLGVAAFGAYRPHLFLNGRRSRFWVEKLGEAGAVKLVRFVSVPLIVVFSLFFLVAGAMGVNPNSASTQGKTSVGGQTPNP